MNSESRLIRSGIKALTPDFVIRGVKKLQTAIQRRRLPETQEVFRSAKPSPAYLGEQELRRLQDRYPFLPDYGYDRESTERRGALRAKQILRLPAASSTRSYLELGCWDGMVSCQLQRSGKKTTAIDLRSEGFDERARQEGVTLMRMDAEDLQFEEESFDCVFSYDTFEHVARPDIFLLNAIRVLKRGGYLFLSFGPLYLSPFGQHAYRSITVPYCHLLFPGPLLNEFAASRGLKTIDFSRVNGWPVTAYRRLWEQHSPSLRTVRYEERLNLAHLDVIRSHPSCFRSKTEYFDDLVVETIDAVFEKVG